jgi:hypothetical protein
MELMCADVMIAGVLWHTVFAKAVLACQQLSGLANAWDIIPKVIGFTIRNRLVF